jgi:hypothetical protein
MLAIEHLSGLIAESGHLQLVNLEPVNINGVDDFANISVCVRLDHGEGALAIDLETLSCGNIRVVSDLELAAKHGDDCADEEIVDR